MLIIYRAVLLERMLLGIMTYMQDGMMCVAVVNVMITASG